MIRTYIFETVELTERARTENILPSAYYTTIHRTSDSVVYRVSESPTHINQDCWADRTLDRVEVIDFSGNTLITRPAVLEGLEFLHNALLTVNRSGRMSVIDFDIFDIHVSPYGDRDLLTYFQIGSEDREGNRLFFNIAIPIHEVGRYNSYLATPGRITVGARCGHSGDSLENAQPLENEYYTERFPVTIFLHTEEGEESWRFSGEWVEDSLGEGTYSLLNQFIRRALTQIGLNAIAQLEAGSVSIK